MWALRVCLSLGLLLGLAGCQPADQYYPLRSGARWRFVTSGELHVLNATDLQADGIRRATMPVDINDFFVDRQAQRPRQIGGRDTTPIQSTDQRDPSPRISYWTVDRLGIAEIARDVPGVTEPQLLPEPLYVVRFPIRVGTTWDIRETRGSGDAAIAMVGSARIVALDERVTVPAGVFPRCVRIDATMTGSKRIANLNGRGIDGEAETQISASTWLAPGVGIVKSIQRQTFTPSSLGSGEQILELQSFAPG